MFADLHLHSLFSDGTYSPEELAALGQQFGFAALALTDHDTVEGCARMAAACAAAGIDFITGTELTAEQDGNELHFLGYFIDTAEHEIAVRNREVPGRPTGPHPRNGRATQPVERAADGGSGFCAGELPLARPAARRPRAGERGPLRHAGQGVRAVPQKKPARVGAENENVRRWTPSN